MSKFVLLYILLFATNIFSQFIKPSDEIVYEKFLTEAYNFNFPKAKKIADSLSSSFPRSPLGLHAISLLQTWYYLGKRDEKILNDFFVHSDSTLEKFEHLGNLDENPFYLFRIAEEYAFRAIMYAFDYNNFSAFLATRKSISYFNDITDYYPNFYDAYSGPAVFGYFLSFAPSYLKTGLRLIGVNTNVKENIEAFKKTYEKGTFAKPEAAFQLAKIYSDYYLDIEKSNEYLTDLITEFPKNIFFQYQYAINEIRSKKFDTAQKILRKITNYKNPNFVQIVAYSYFLLGEINFTINKFDSAVVYYEKYFATTRSINFMGYANYKCGVANIFINKLEKAREYFLLSSYGNPDNFKDEFAHERSEKILETNFKIFDKNLVLAENYVDAGKYELAKQSCKKIKDRNSLRALFVCSEIFVNNNNYLESKKILNHIKNRDLKLLARIKYLYLFAFNEYEHSNNEKAKEYLNKLFETANMNNELFAKARNLAIKVGYNLD